MFKRLANRADLAGEIRRGEKYYREIIHNLGNIGMIFTNPERYPELNCFEDAEFLKQEGHLTEFEVDEIKKRTKKGGALKRYTTTAFPLSSSSGPSGKTYKVENVPYLEECRQAKDLTISEIEEIENSNTAE